MREAGKNFRQYRLHSMLMESKLPLWARRLLFPVYWLASRMKL
jgi:hypothetical protein